MQIITFEHETFQKLMQQLNAISEKLNKSSQTSPLTEVWLDNQDVCQLLKVSKRTLQHYRDSGQVPFSQIGAKIYYKASDIEAFLSAHYNEQVKKK
jgi:hypothetical protein